MQSEFSPLIVSLLEKRGLTEPHTIAAFLAPDYELHSHDPFLMDGMDRAVVRLLSALERGERIAIYADYDCDGIPGAAILSDFFTKIGYENFEVYLPHRDREGYGFHTDAIEQLAHRNVALIITVDVGTNAFEGARVAKERGVDVIITDHHEITGALPECVALLNPKLAPYPYPHLCGAAVAYKLVQATLREGRSRGAFSIPEGWEKWLLDLVAIATVADMVPLTGENRVLAFWGLSVLRKSPRPGIRAICSALRLRQEELSEEEIGFSLAPRINAASRMDEPQSALRLLTTHDRQEAEVIASHLESLNASRKGVVAGYVREAKRHARARFGAEESVVVLGSPDWKPSLLGLAANSILEERGGVVCLWGRDALGRIKGSCRSDGSYSVVELFTRASAHFEEFGGHEKSGGFTLRSEQVHTLHETLARMASEMEKTHIVQSGAHDALISVREAASPLLRDISRLAPYGIGNPKPVFRIAQCAVGEIRRFGKQKNHLELSLVCTQTGAQARAFDFFRSPEDFTHAPVVGSEAHVLATLERDTYRGGTALRILDILAA